jgi:hypothetical protein
MSKGKGWSYADFEREFPSTVGPEPKSEFIVVSVGAGNKPCHCESGLDAYFNRPHMVQDHGPTTLTWWDEEVAQNTAAILADHGG